jgi:hypothetical protein
LSPRWLEGRLARYLVVRDALAEEDGGRVGFDCALIDAAHKDVAEEVGRTVDYVPDRIEKAAAAGKNP